MTTEAYKPLTTAENIFKSVIWTPLLNSGQLIVTPYLLAIPIVGPVLSVMERVALGFVSNWLFEKLRLFMDVTAIKLVNSAHQSAYDTASLKLQIIADESGENSDEFKKAVADAALAQSKFTRVFQ